MNNVGFLDFGYLKAAAAASLGVSGGRLRPVAEECVKWIVDAGTRLPGNPRFLRLYWYDGAFDPGDARHASQRRFFDAIERTPGIRLRRGHVLEYTPKWQYPLKQALRALDVDSKDFERHFRFRPELVQKGVDTRITLDLVSLAQRRVYDVAVLIAGDRDLAEPVRVAQDEGRRVIVATPAGAGLAWELKHLADGVLTIDAAALGRMFRVSR